MTEKLYTSRSMDYSVLRYEGAPEGKASFTFYCDTPVPNGTFTKVAVGNKINGDVWCPKAISPHPSRNSNFKAPDFNVTDLRCEDVIIGELNGTPYRQYKFTAEGWLSNGENSGSSGIVSYTVNAEARENEDIFFSASIETICTAKSEIGSDIDINFIYNIGTEIKISNVPVKLKCTGYKMNDGFDEFSRHVWTVVFEFSGSLPANKNTELPEEEVQDLAYEINGVTVRTVAGELLVLRRSENPIIKKTVVAYSNDVNPVYSPGDTCYDGIALSEKVIEETKEYWDEESQQIENFTCYRHEIEVEV